MAILNFVKPDKIVLQKSTDFEAQFEFRPLEPGYGVTIGNALRRVLLNSLEGYAIVGISIAGADHEFATIKGITEDVTEIILNLKQVRFKKKTDQESGTEKISLSLKNKTEFTAGMIGEASPAFEVMNPELADLHYGYFCKTRYRDYNCKRPWICSGRRKQREKFSFWIYSY